MRFIALALSAAAAASCGSSLGEPAGDAGPTADKITLPGWPAPDCRIFNPTACRLDLAQTSVGIDVDYPNVAFCGLQLLPTRDTFNTAAYATLAAAWQVSLGGNPSDQIVLTPTTPQGVLEYPLGTQQLYLARVTFTSTTYATIATL